MASCGWWALAITVLSVLVFYLLPFDQALLIVYSFLFALYPARKLRQWVSTWSGKARNALGILGLAVASVASYVLWSERRLSTIGANYAVLLTVSIAGATLGTLPVWHLVTWLSRRLARI
jgi:hypothetical protein